MHHWGWSTSQMVFSIWLHLFSGVSKNHQARFTAGLTIIGGSTHCGGEIPKMSVFCRRYFFGICFRLGYFPHGVSPRTSTQKKSTAQVFLQDTLWNSFWGIIVFSTLLAMFLVHPGIQPAMHLEIRSVDQESYDIHLTLDSLDRYDQR